MLETLAVRRAALAGTAALLLLAGCSSDYTRTDRALIGGAVGAGTGALAGAALVGGAAPVVAGAIVGGAAGAVIGAHVEP